MRPFNCAIARAEFSAKILKEKAAVKKQCSFEFLQLLELDSFYDTVFSSTQRLDPEHGHSES